jgi:hypothetical protein
MALSVIVMQFRISFAIVRSAPKGPVGNDNMIDSFGEELQMPSFARRYKDL